MPEPRTEAGFQLSPLNTKTRLPLLILLGVVGVGILLSALHTIAGLGASADELINEYVYNVVLASAALVCLLRGALVSRERGAWIAFGVGVGCWAAGDVYWTAAARTEQSPATAGYFYLAGYPALYAGILLLVSARVERVGLHMWLDGKEAEERLEDVGITVNRNAIPFDERPPMNPSGLRIGTPALTTRGLVEDDMREIAEVVCAALSDRFDSEKDALLERSRALMDRYPLYPQLSPAAV